MNFGGMRDQILYPYYGPSGHSLEAAKQRSRRFAGVLYQKRSGVLDQKRPFLIQVASVRWAG